MTQSAFVSQHGSEFEPFLFAPIGDDRNGMLLSVLSGLARLDIDPWNEAAKLALMPVAIATQRLASFIAALPDGPSGHRDSGTIATRLIALLPRPIRSNAPPAGTVQGAGPGAKSRALVQVVLINAVFLAFVIGAQLVLGGHQPAPQAQHLPAHAADAVSAPTPPAIPEP